MTKLYEHKMEISLTTKKITKNFKRDHWIIIMYKIDYVVWDRLSRLVKYTWGSWQALEV